jgi:abortive infection bacteriophage resistance protein
MIGLPAPLPDGESCRVMWPRGDVLMSGQIKHPTTYKQQLDKLRERGCQIDDSAACLSILSRLNYYRFTAYFLPFKQTNGKYQPNTNFNTVYRIYEFDRKIRGILFSVIEEIEIFLRSQFAYFHAHKYGSLGYMDAGNFNAYHNHDKFLGHINGEKANRKKELFVKHHRQKYDNDFPVWVVTELFTFGMLSHVYSDLKTADQKKLAKELYDTIPKKLISWLHCCADLRNLCAHSGRLYDRIFTAAPVPQADIPQKSERRLFGAVMVVKSLYPEKDKWNKEIYPAFCALLQEYQNDIQLKHIGFPNDWASKLMFAGVQ